MKYIIPFIGIYFVWRDIPHTPDQYAYKPLQGDIAFPIMALSFMSTVIGAIFLHLLLDNNLILFMVSYYLMFALSYLLLSIYNNGLIPLKIQHFIPIIGCTLFIYDYLKQ